MSNKVFNIALDYSLTKFETMENTENLILEILKGSKETINAKLKESVEKQILEQMSYSLRDKISVATSKFVEEEMSEEIKATLLKVKPQILQELETGLVKIGAKLAETMYIQAAKNLDVGNYGTRELLKKLFD